MAWPLGAVLLLGLLGSVVPLVSGKTEVVTLREDVDPYELITADVVTTATVLRHELDEDAITRKSEVIGSLAARKLTSDTQIGSGDVINVARRPRAESLTVELAPEHASAVGIEEGALVTMRLAPRADDANLAPVAIPALFLAVGGTKESPTYILSVPGEEADAIANLAARSDLILTPVR